MRELCRDCNSPRNCFEDNGCHKTGDVLKVVPERTMKYYCIYEKENGDLTVDLITDSKTDADDYAAVYGCRVATAI